MQLRAWPLALVLALACAQPALAAPADSVSVMKRPRLAAPT